MPDRSRALALQHREVQRRLRAVATDSVKRRWTALGSYDAADVERFVPDAVRMVEAAQRRSAIITDAYLGRVLERQPLGIDPARVIGAAARRGTEPPEVYRRPFATMWRALDDGKPYQEALDQGLDRLTSTVGTDIQLAMRGAAREVMETDLRIYGWQRVTGDACDFCLLASTQRYHTGDLMPLHNHCGCTVEPLYVETGQVINRDLIDELDAKDATGRINADTTGLDLEDASREVAIREHGELGPVLTDARHSFTGPRDI